jgi:endonuclease YncB( thermonuclease family)
MFSKFNCFSKKPKISFVQTSTATVLEKYPKKQIIYEDSQPFVPPITQGQVVKVYDGNTFAVACYLPYDESPLYRFIVRLSGDTYNDIHQTALANTELSNMILGKTIAITNVRNGHLGRVIADVYVKGVHVNQHMLDMKWSVP